MFYSCNSMMILSLENCSSCDICINWSNRSVSLWARWFCSLSCLISDSFSLICFFKCALSWFPGVVPVFDNYEIIDLNINSNLPCFRSWNLFNYWFPYRFKFFFHLIKLVFSLTCLKRNAQLLYLIEKNLSFVIFKCWVTVNTIQV